MWGIFKLLYVLKGVVADRWLNEITETSSHQTRVLRQLCGGDVKSSSVSF